MPDGLYERDVLLWAEQQASLLRRLAAGERLNEAIDWPHLIEEVQDVGISELRACQSLLRQSLLHLLKLATWPESPAAAHWRSETLGFLADLRSRYTPSMAQRIDLPAIYAQALRQLRAEAATANLPPTCDITLPDLLAESADPVHLVLLIQKTP